jgi:hypothetical protein
MKPTGSRSRITPERRPWYDPIFTQLGFDLSIARRQEIGAFPSPQCLGVIANMLIETGQFDIGLDLVICGKMYGLEICQLGTIDIFDTNQVVALAHKIDTGAERCRGL